MSDKTKAILSIVIGVVAIISGFLPVTNEIVAIIVFVVATALVIEGLTLSKKAMKTEPKLAKIGRIVCLLYLVIFIVIIITAFFSGIITGE